MHRRLRSAPAAILAGLLIWSSDAPAQSRIMGKCDVSFEARRFDGPQSLQWAVRFCDVRDNTSDRWEAKLQRLDAGWRELSAAKSAENWGAYRAKWAELLPVMKEFEAAALTSQRVAGAKALVSFYRSELGLRLHQAAFGWAEDLDTASSRILAGLTLPRAAVAAEIGVLTALESGSRGTVFVRGLAVVASQQVLDDYRSQQGQGPR